MSLTKIIEDTAYKYPRRTAIILGDRKITYQKLVEEIVRISSNLISLGLKPQEKVGLLLQNSPEFVISYFAVLKAGGIVVPLNNFLQVDELRFILENCRVEMLISELSQEEKISVLRLRIDHLHQVIFVDGEGGDFLSFSQFKKVEPGRWPVLDIDGVAVILYTSGTTGYPKGAMLSHHNLIANVRACSQATSLRSGDCFLCVLPMFHSFCFTASVLMPLFAGGKIVIFVKMRPFSAVIKGIMRRRVNILVGIPSLFQILADLKLPWFLRLPFFSFLMPIKLAISGADKLPVKVLEAFNKKFKFPLLEGYGLTEASPVVSVNPLDMKRKAGSVGLPLPGIQVKIVDQSGETLPANQIGELIVKGPNVMKGYLNRPEETRQVLKEGWLSTGDIARIDEDGYIYIVDRKNDLIIHHGLNIYPREVENVLYCIPQIGEVAVIGVKEERRGEIAVAMVVLKPDEKITEREIISFARQQLAPYKVPRQVIFKEALPKTATGKIAKKALKLELNRD